MTTSFPLQVSVIVFTSETSALTTDKLQLLIVIFSGLRTIAVTLLPLFNNSLRIAVPTKPLAPIVQEVTLYSDSYHHETIIDYKEFVNIFLILFK